jgi:YHS domain-containing protein
MQAAAMGIYDEGVMDPVCGMYIDEKKARAAGRTTKFSGATYFFCSPECLHDFEKAPKKYQAAPGAQSAAAAPAVTSPAIRSMAVATPVMSTMPTRDHPVMPAPGISSPAMKDPALSVPSMNSPTGTRDHH